MSFLNFLVGRAVLERLGETVLRVLESALGIRKAAVLDAQRDMPELIDRALHAGPRLIVVEPVGDRAQAEIDAQVLDERLGLERQRVERGHDLFAIARIVEKLAALLDDCARQRLRELALGKDHLEALAAPGLSGDVLGLERHDHLEPGPRMRGDLEIACALGRRCTPS